MNSKNKISGGLVALALAGICALEVGHPSGLNKETPLNPPKKTDEQKEITQIDREKRDLNNNYSGANLFNEPDYVKIHFWYTPCGDSDWSLHLERVPKGGVPSNSSNEEVKHGFDENGNHKEFVKYDEKNPRFNPFYNEKGLEEYIEDKEGNALGILVLEEGVFYRFYDSNGYRTYKKEEIDKNPEVILSTYRNLYKLIKLTDESISRISNIKLESKKN